MLLFTSALLLTCTAVCQCLNEQKLTCQYPERDKKLPRFWCKMDPDDPQCCTGFSFPPSNSDTMELDDGHLSVQDDGKVFTVSVRSLTMGEGIYWCGLINNNNTVIKLAEINLYNRSRFITWDVLRWILFLLLVLALILVHTNITTKCAQRKKERNTSPRETGVGL